MTEELLKLYEEFKKYIKEEIQEIEARNGETMTSGQKTNYLICFLTFDRFMRWLKDKTN